MIVRLEFSSHPGGNPETNLKLISHRCYLFEEAFVWELTEETIVLLLGCLQGGFQVARIIARATWPWTCISPSTRPANEKHVMETLRERTILNSQRPAETSSPRGLCEQSPCLLTRGNIACSLPQALHRESETVASATLGRSQDVCKGARFPVEGERCVVSS